MALAGTEGVTEGVAEVSGKAEEELLGGGVEEVGVVEVLEEDEVEVSPLTMLLRPNGSLAEADDDDDCCKK